MTLATLFHHPRAGVVLLRTTLALLMLLHGWAKVRGGIGGIETMVAKAGLPPYLAYAVYLGEVVAPLLLLVGVWVVPAALVVAINMVVAVLLVHTGQLLSLGSTGGWALELQALFLVSALVVAMTSRSGKG
ncbi:DoxX family protein [Acidovorax sp. SRB_24]|uniref:DoxX family protein n=1 Tax=Acidovorax sp. SRB_24 TaxID=1962700 RepID=UPI00145D3F80|nr:DoxX family protein [Acidovorax sp. SRB_24]NMM75916.1 DoxX family membrane protein [Acidovorax sp. SRB_24]